MQNIFKKNYEFITCITLLLLILTISFNPSHFIKAGFQGFTVWAQIVLPSMFCFFILTRLLMQNTFTQKIFSPLNTTFSKIYNVKYNAGYIFLMSIIVGYPIGAKLISEFYSNNQITNDEAHRLISFCSTSGPMFILGSVASAMFNNIKLGLIILISHYLSALLNGLIYRNYKINLKIKNTLNKNNKLNANSNTQNHLKQTTIQKVNNISLTKKTLNEIMYDSIISILMIGGFIAISFTIIEIILSSTIFEFFTINLSKVMPNFDLILKPIISGIIELTSGCVYLSTSILPLKFICIVLSALISFGGLSIHLQSNIFLKKCNIKYKYFLLCKVTQTLLSIILSTILAVFLL